MITARGPLLARAGVFVVTLVLLWLTLSFGVDSSVLSVTVGEPSPADFHATSRVEVRDDAATTLAQDVAAEAVAPVFEIEETVALQAEARIEEFITLAQELAVREAPTFVPPALPTPTTTTTTTIDETTSTTSTTLVDGEEPATTVPATRDETLGVVTSRVFLDLDGNGQLDATDVPGEAIEVQVFGGNGAEPFTVRTDGDGVWTAPDVVIDGEVTIWVNVLDDDVPDSFELSTDNNPQTVDGSNLSAITPVGFRPRLAAIDELIAELRIAAPDLDEATILTVSEFAQADVLRSVNNQPSVLLAIREAAISVAKSELDRGIKRSELNAARANIEFRPPRIVVDQVQDTDAENAAADIASSFLDINNFEDARRTEQLQVEARALTPDETELFLAELRIVGQGEVVTQTQAAAIDKLGLSEPDTLEKGAMAALIGVTMLLLFIYLARFRPGFWGSFRRVSLFGLIMVIGAAAVRGAEALEAVESLGMLAGYALPAAGFGFLVAVVFDARIAVLFSLAMASIVAMVFQDPGLVLYSALATVAPVPMVASISSNGDQTRAILATGATSMVMAGTVSWFFHASVGTLPPLTIVTTAVLLAGVVGLVSSVLAIFLVQVFEVAFDITTNLRLLVLVDRNHEALQLLQEKAWGTFNHSLMVGTLADRAARTIGANALLARASAYYHDLGKTENPIFFIENQFGITNPHDMLEPIDSVAIIRQHVTDGVALARRFNLPSEVAEGISSHHGDGIMRYFYETAKEQLGEENVNPDDYRHLGHKPRSKEMAIVMMADSLEGATRAVFTTEEPTRERIEAVVSTIVGEKVADGQLSECALTLGELTQVKQAFVEVFVGHYHQRIAYPDFTEAPLALEAPSPEVAELPDETIEGDQS